MKKLRVFQIVEFVCRLGLGVLFIYSALAKISDPYDFAFSVMRYRILPDFTIGIFSLTMPVLELLAGLSMIFTKWVRESALLVTGMFAMFIVALVQALARGLDISCGCFGVPSVGGREEILIALIRDVVLVVPAAWLMFRPNTRLWPLRWLSKGWRIFCLFGVGTLLAAWFIKDMWDSGAFAPSLASEADEVSDMEEARLSPRAEDATGSDIERQGSWLKLAVSSGPIRPGEWNVDFEGVLAKAEREQRPMVLVYASSTCGYCTRLEECIAGEIFRQWREDRAPLMTFVRAGSRISPSETVKASYKFIQRINKDVPGKPFVCVYWPQDGVTNSVVFSGRRGMMGGRKDRLLVVELMSALDRALGERLTAGHRTLESMVRTATARISARADGAGGTVTMTPENGLLAEGKNVALVAHPDAEYAFLDWRQPDGSLASMESKLVVYWDMPVGCYTARFKSRSQCLPPRILSPSETSIRVKVKERFSHEILVDESCRPFKFQIKRPVTGVTVNPITGVVTGEIPQAMTNTVEIAVIGHDPAQTEKDVRLTIECYQKRYLNQKGKLPHQKKRFLHQKKHGD